MNILLYAIPFLAGVLNAIHSGTNAKLTETLERPWWASVIVCAIAGSVLFVGVLVTRERFPSLASIAGTPWWAWAGTAIAGVPVITTLLYAGRLGGAAFNGLVITSTMIASIVLDNYGLLGFSEHPANLWRILGALIMLAGMTLVCIF